MMPVSAFVIPYLLLLLLHAAALAEGKEIFTRECPTTPLPERCINFGSLTEAVGKYHHERNLVQFDGDAPRSYTKFARVSITNVEDDISRAFAVQRMAKNMSFFVNVSSEYHYDIDLGFAELRFCENHGALTTVVANGVQIAPFNVFRSVGCNALYTASVLNVPVMNGGISVSLNSSRKVGLATACFRRRAPALTVSSECQQKGCRNIRGPADFVIVHGSLARADDACGLDDLSVSHLVLRPDVSVLSATLQWTASGTPPGNITSIMLNGRNVSSTFLQRHDRFHVRSDGKSDMVYVASADVTAIVQRDLNGTYEVGGLFYEKGASCGMHDGAHVAGWALVVTYERADFPMAQINVCAMHGDVIDMESKIGTECIVPVESSRTARTSVVVYEGEPDIRDTFTINGDVMGSDLFKGGTALRMDVLSFPIEKFVTSGVDRLVFGFPNCTDGIVMPVRVTYQTI